MQTLSNINKYRSKKLEPLPFSLGPTAWLHSIISTHGYDQVEAMSEEEQKNQSISDFPAEEASSAQDSQELTQEHPDQDARSQPTGESADIQAQVSNEAPSPHSNGGAQEGPKWITDLIRYHNDMNGLLAAKENLKLVALDLAVKPSFRFQWSLEANNVMRITAILRRRLAKGVK